MAKDFIDDSVYLAAGIRPEEVGMEKGDLLKKAGLIKAVKEYSQQSGGAIGSETLTKVIRSITQTIVDKVQTTVVSSTKAIVPTIESELFKIGELLKSSKEDDQSKALDMIETLQQRFGINLKNFSKELSVNLDKLVQIMNTKKEQRNQEKEILKEKINESKKQQEILRQQGILTFVNKETGRLQIKSFKDEKLEKEKLLLKEKQINEFRKKIIEEEKKYKIVGKDEANAKEGERLAKKFYRLSQLEAGLEKRKSTLGVPSKEKIQTTGPIGDTLSSAFSTMKQSLMMPIDMFKYFKGMGQEILSITNKFTGLNKILSLFTNGMKLLGGGLKTIGSSIGSLMGLGGRGGVGSAAAGIARGAGSAAGGLGALASPGLLAGLAGVAGVGALGFGAKKLYDYNKSKGVDIQKENFADTYSPEISLPSSKNIIPLMERNQLQESLISGSKEYIRQPTSNNNTVLAPSNNVSNVNQSSPTVLNMEVSNFDRTFINLNTPSVSV